MNASLATDVLGLNRTPVDVRNMVKALSLHSWNNTPEEVARLQAGTWLLKNWRAYQVECNARRDALHALRLWGRTS